MNIIKAQEKIIRNQEEILAYAKENGLNKVVLASTQIIVSAQQIVIHEMQKRITSSDQDKTENTEQLNGAN